MIALGLDEQRCEKCQKLLFRGLVGIGFIEVKCSRCGQLNLLNSYDAMLRGTPGAYVIVYDKDGTIIAATNTIEKILGYGAEDLKGMRMNAIDDAFKLQSIKSQVQDKALDEWVGLHKSFPSTVSHRYKDGSSHTSNARYYPLGSFSGVYTIGIFYATDAHLA